MFIQHIDETPARHTPRDRRAALPEPEYPLRALCLHGKIGGDHDPREYLVIYVMFSSFWQSKLVGLCA